MINCLHICIPVWDWNDCDDTDTLFPAFMLILTLASCLASLYSDVLYMLVHYKRGEDVEVVI